MSNGLGQAADGAPEKPEPRGSTPRRRRLEQVDPFLGFLASSTTRLKAPLQCVDFGPFELEDGRQFVGGVTCATRLAPGLIELGNARQRAARVPVAIGTDRPGAVPVVADIEINDVRDESNLVECDQSGELVPARVS